MPAMETMRLQRNAFETIRSKIQDSLNRKDFDAMNLAIDDACVLYHIKVPYSTPAEFVKYVQQDLLISIA